MQRFIMQRLMQRFLMERFMKSSMKRSIVVFCIIASLITCNAIANEEYQEASLSQDMIIDLDTVVVTATRYEKLLKDVPQNVTVIDAKELEEKSANTLAEILEDVVGLQIKSYGATGSNVSVSLRGMTSSQVLIMVDGRPINSFQDGMVDLSTIPVNTIASIEIVRGAASSLYGSNAMGGVINIITKKASDNSIELSYGTFDTFHNELTVSNDIDNFTYTITASKDSSNGDRPNSDYDAENLNYYSGYRFTDDFSIDFRAGYFNSKLGTPGTTAWEDYNDKQFNKKYYADVELNLPAGVLLKAYTNYSAMKFEEDVSSVAEHKNLDMSTEVRIARDLTENNHIVLGAAYHNYSLNSTEVDYHSMQLTSGYLQDEMRFSGAATRTIGVRYDSYRDIDAEFSPSLALLFYLPGDTALRLSAGKSFKVPTFNDLYWPSTQWAEGNPDLKPEKGISYDTSIDTQLSSGLWVRVSGFYNDIEEMINWAPGDDFVYRPYNIDNAVIKGLETEVRAKFFEIVTADIGYTLIDTEDEETGQDIIYQPDNKVDAKIDIALENTSFAFSLEHVGKRYHNEADENGERIRLNEYTIYNAKISHEFSSSTIVYLKGENLLDKEYSYQKDYPLPGAAFYGGMKVMF